MSDRQPGRQGLFEFVVVLLVVALVAATGVRYILKAIDEAWQVSLATQAQVFTSTVALVHWTWVSKGLSFLPALDSAPAAIRVDEIPVYVNQYGWPTHTDIRLHNKPLAAEGCLQIWDTLLQNPGQAQVVSDPIEKSSEIQVQVVEHRKCRYAVYTKSSTVHYFDYDVTNGRVQVMEGVR